MWTGTVLTIVGIALLVYLGLIWSLCCTASWADDQMDEMAREKMTRRNW